MAMLSQGEDDGDVDKDSDDMDDEVAERIMSWNICGMEFASKRRLLGYMLLAAPESEDGCGESYVY
ncbi:hypothetical protein NC653_015331 [Populus alba x Populus x berolinensis]|uniref:Uncharacterized protein n=1 Tax=Populus alba x Populus x berolinensis TaxID=444605 RepID=A0AAD6VYA9_9ROSI|nr:hypothetical protein NC653_015331 [Populus alba x Populus x berolinensis]